MKQLNKEKLINEALSYHNMGKLSDADKIYQNILKKNPNDFDANHLHALILSQSNKYAKSIEYFSKAYSLGPVTCELLNNFAIAYRNLKAYSECEKLLLEAIALDKTFVNTYKNLANCFLSQNKDNDALEVLETASNLGSDKGNILLRIIEILYTKIDNTKDSKYNIKYEKYARELGMESEHSYKALSALCYLHLDKFDESLKSFKEAENLISNMLPHINTLKELKNKNILKNIIKHEYEQITHIDSDSDGIRNVKITQIFYDSLKRLYNKNNTDYSDEDYEFISSLHKIRYNKAPKVRQSYLNKNLDIDTHEKIYSESKPEVVVIDDFLNQEFLIDLNRYFRCANIFKYPYPRGYIGAFLGKGMANRAILELSKELSKSFPKIFKNYNLSQAWAFKYDSKQDGISIHADDAKVNVNFWITDDTANLNKETGGLIIWKKKPAAGTKFADFNSLSHIPKMEKEIKNTDSIKISYNANRAVIFDSKLYHATDDISFKDSYINRRINVTFLYK
tara:strand:+ start:2144 stop:3673 length:1530 start_codon:yes stop_codon:yes gene_type:complete